MPFYTRTIPHHDCSEPGCKKPATVMVFNTHNAPVAPYCTRHGDAVVDKLNKL